MASKKQKKTTISKNSNISEKVMKNKSKNIYSLPNQSEEYASLDAIPPKTKEEEKQERTIRCVSCGKSSINMALYPNTYSSVYAAYDFHLPICKDCLDKLYDTLLKNLESPYKTYRRICMLFDVYYNDNIVNTALKIARPNRNMTCYISKAALRPYAGRTYADTLIEDEAKEELLRQQIEAAKSAKTKSAESDNYRFWGFGFTDEDYEYLNNKYSEWIMSHECNDHAQQVIFKQMSMLELQILKNQLAEKPTAPLLKQLNEFMNSGNLQPKQNNNNTMVEANTFGTLIKKWENEKPISQPSPEWEDVDGIKKYISVWFLGHLANMIGIKNKLGEKWSKVYDDEVEKYTVKPPNYFEEDEEAPSFDDLFNQ